MIKPKNSIIQVFLFLIIIISSASAQQNSMGFREAKVELLGVANDTAFISYSHTTTIQFNTATSKMSLELSINSLNDNHVLIDSVLKSMKEIKLYLEMGIDKNLFGLYRNENSNHNTPFFGTLLLGEEMQKVQGIYRIYRATQNSISETLANSNAGALLLDLNFYFEPFGFNNQELIQFSNPLELIVKGAFINQSN